MISSLTDADCFVGYIIVMKEKSIFPTNSFHSIIRLTFFFNMTQSKSKRHSHWFRFILKWKNHLRKYNTGLLESLDTS